MKNSRLLLAFILLCFLAFSAVADEDKEIKYVKAVDWNELAKILPGGLFGMIVGDIDGGTLTMADPKNPRQQFSYSNVSRKYTKGKDENEKEIKITITDSGFNQLLLTPFLMSFEYDSPDGSMKSIEIKDQKAKLVTEKEKGVLESCNLMVLVAERFLVLFEGNENITVEEIKEAASKLDYEKLAGLAKASE